MDLLQVRGFLARRRRLREQEARARYEREMERLEREAWLLLVRRQREEDAKRMQVTALGGRPRRLRLLHSLPPFLPCLGLQAEQERRRQEQLQRKREAELREAAFENDVATLAKLADQVPERCARSGSTSHSDARCVA